MEAMSLPADSNLEKIANTHKHGLPLLRHQMLTQAFVCKICLKTNDTLTMVSSFCSVIVIVTDHLLEVIY